MEENYIYKKEVDWSLFNYGFAIPLEYQVVFKQIADRYIRRGESETITLYLEGKSYKARLNNNRIADKFGNHADIVQVRYSQNSELAVALRSVFCKSYTYILNEKKKQEAGSKTRITLPDEYKEYLVIYTTEYDDAYVLEAIVSDDLLSLSQEIKGKSEKQIEAELNYTQHDKSAGILIRPRLAKIRKLNRLIGENLKLLYGYRCQICGQLIGEEFGSHIVEAHHIEYFVNSMNNDASNQMIVCPNHHSIIHDKNPVFDRQHKEYHFPNGVIQKLTLNTHL